jgi:hypothetical protein
MDKLPTDRQEKKNSARGKSVNITDQASKGKQEKAQPWKDLLEEIDSVNKKAPLEGDFFIAKDGFYAHSLAA